ASLASPREVLERIASRLVEDSTTDRSWTTLVHRCPEVLADRLTNLDQVAVMSARDRASLVRILLRPRDLVHLATEDVILRLTDRRDVDVVPSEVLREPSDQVILTPPRVEHDDRTALQTR